MAVLAALAMAVALLVAAIVVGWLAIKVVGWVLKLALWVALAGIAYYFFAEVFGWPWPFG